MPAFDVKKQIPQGRAQTTRRVELKYTLDFAKLGDGTGLAETESAEFAILPAGYVHERLDAILRKAEGTAATIDVGTEADPDCFGDGLNVNGTPNQEIALAGTEAAGPGTYFHTNTPVWVTTPSGGATVAGAVVELIFVGYLTETGEER